MDVLKNPELRRSRALVWHFPNLWGETQDRNEGYGAYSAIIEGDYHLIYFWETREMRLYNIREDIGEQNNLADREPEKVAKLAARLTAELKRCHAQRPSLKATGEVIAYPDGSLQ